MGQMEQALNTTEQQIEPTVLETPDFQGSASDFTASKSDTKSTGVGFAFYCPFFDPTDVEENTSESRLYTNLVPSQIDMEREDVLQFKEALRNTLMITIDMTKISETPASNNPFNIQEKHLDKIAKLQLFLETSTSFSVVKDLGVSRGNVQTLAEMGCTGGVATLASVPDGRFVDGDGNTRGIAEVKHSTNAPVESLRQASIEGTNIAYMLHDRGTPALDVMVPIVSSNGMLVQFGAVLLLDPCFPYVVTLSTTLDMCREEDLTLTAAFLWRIGEYVRRKSMLGPVERDVRKKRGLNPVTYHLKSLTDFFCSKDSIHPSLFHFFRCMGIAHRGTCKDFVVFPLCLRIGKPSEGPCLVFPAMQKYSIGVPENLNLRDSFITEVRESQIALSKANLVHMDFYPSNIMWMKSDDHSVKVKLIDFDAVQVKNSRMTEEVRSRLSIVRTQVYSKYAGLDANTEIVSDKWDSSLVDVMDKHRDQLTSSDKATLDTAFISACHRYVET